MFPASAALSQDGVLALAFDQLPQAVLLYDRGLTITGVNQAAEGLLRLPAQSLVGRTCREAFRCPVCDPVCGLVAGIHQASGVPGSTVRIHTGAGQERLLEIRTSRIASGAGIVANLNGITENAAPAEFPFIAVSPSMRAVVSFVRRIAGSQAGAILLEGESGTGKEVIAKLLHYHSMRRDRPLVALNCAAMPETLLESELFGAERGAFTGARERRQGLLERADGGTVLLDEIGELPLRLQTKLLRVLEERSFRRVGGLVDVFSDLRVIAATNRDLRRAVDQGSFRRDLYYRLNIIQILLPPLRERREDILPLTYHFLGHCNRKFGRDIQGLSARAERHLRAHDWPGNVRELRNAVERAVLLEPGPLLEPAGFRLDD